MVVLITEHTVVRKEIYNLVFRLLEYADPRGRSITEIGGWNPADVLAVRFLCVLCVVCCVYNDLLDNSAPTQRIFIEFDF